jgi:hypothetical protein
MENICNFCFNAHVYNSLPKTEEDYYDVGIDNSNDMCAMTIGESASKHQMYFNSGNGRPCNIEVCEWKENGYHGKPGWATVGRYYPKFCPECGRKLDEYEISERGVSFK